MIGRKKQVSGRGGSSRFPIGGILTKGVCMAMLLSVFGGDVSARLNDDQMGVQQEIPQNVSPVLQFLSHFHNVGKLILHISNQGIFGTMGNADFNVAPSAQWLPGQPHDYLYAAGLWVGGVVENENGDVDTLVSAAVYQREFWPDFFDPLATIYESWEGRPGGQRYFDDDGDGSVDEDELDGRNNDPWNDTRVDEDHAAVSQQMFRCTYYDTTDFNERLSDPRNFHFPLGLRVTQESYQWVATNWDDFVGIDFRIENISDESIRNAYVGFMTDSDVGNTRLTNAIFTDDLSNFITQDTTLIVLGADDEELSLNIAYMRDAEGGDDGSDASGLFGVMFLGHTVDSSGVNAPAQVEIHAYRSWSSGEEDPENDRERYRYLRGSNRLGNLWLQHIDPPESRAADYRMLVSAGPFREILPGDILEFQSAFVMLDSRGLDRDDEDVVRTQMLGNAIAAQRIYNRDWTAASAPPPPNQRLVPGDHRITVEWDNFSELTTDPLSGKFDFEGYQIWKAVGWRRETADPRDDQWFLIADIDREKLSDFDTGSQGIGKYRFIDTKDVKNGFPYWYAVVAYDHGDEESGILPEFGKFSQAKQLVYARFGPTRTIDDAVDVYEVDEATGDVLSKEVRTVENVRVVPNPYKERAAWDESDSDMNPTGRKIYFVNLPERATISIYTLAGDLVQTIEHSYSLSPEVDRTFWNLVTRNNQEVVSGVYIYYIESNVGSKAGRFAIIR